ncbi:MAG: diphthine--ammonia ligase [Chloroflexi bacterium]|nr:diphthine--ammonia ligase [Chloroflexota bacterium]
MRVSNSRAFVSWSGGKDSCLALHRALARGWQVPYLLTMVSREFGRSGAHGVEARVMQAQAEAMGIPMVQRLFDRDTYEAEFKAAIAQFKGEGMGTMVTGDLYLDDHRVWMDRVCQETGIQAVRPLWEAGLTALFQEFLDTGFEALVVSADASLMGDGWVGRWLDASFEEDLQALGKVDLMGELGEYHTLVVDGPLFRKRLEIQETAAVLRDGRWFLDIRRYALADKG